MVSESLTKLTWLAGATMTASLLVVLYKKLLACPAVNGIPLPPGPPARWFWDNALPRANIARTLSDWVSQYGPVISLRQGNHVIIVVGRVDAACDIMEKEGGALVDRPRSIAAGELLSNGMRILLEGSGERFRRLRKAVHTHLQPKAAETYQSLQMENARNVILDILDDPKHHQEHAERYAASVILRVTYGKSTPTANTDPEVVRIHKVLEHFQLAMRPGAHLIDRIPILKHLPGYGRDLISWHHEELQLFREQLNRVKGEMATEEASPSFVKTLIQHGSEHHLSNDEMSYLAGTLFGAGADTTAVAITNCIMAAACHPEAQARVQEELDMVVGPNRGTHLFSSPLFEDEESLPQLQAFIQEALRWKPVTPMGFPHRATKDIIWRGQCIPAGATVFGIHLAIARDPVAFPDAEKFDPQRWLDDEGNLRTDIRFFTFGFGRRVCPGQHVANRSIFVNLALLLWSFRIAENPRAPIDTNAFSDSVISHAAPFDAEFIPRMDRGALRSMMEKYGEIRE
ncbi:cytochrome P450 [Leucogyrophana mollusca]|uniref:Cytochrome P450 n=1 Tax=Leucogyrophana mollusca TaxID=85980 RepID=A0ACB8BDE4_9AGAM|nr:cytochrome P450 [Leucogyrophana mollusca]